MNTGLTLVLGGTGKTGRRVVERLVKRHQPVRIGSRTGQPRFDWDDKASWPAVLQGVESAYVSFYPDLAIPGTAETIQRFADAAVEQGVRRLVLLSGRGEPEAERCEAVVRRSGAEWTIVRSSWFCQNFSESLFLDAIVAGELALPIGDDVGEPFVDADDLADVAVEALTDAQHNGQVYEVTGPHLLTFADAVAEIARESGRRIKYVQVSREAYASALAQDLPPEVVKLVMYLFTDVLDGRNAHVTDGVQRGLGRAPRDFTAYARDAAATGVWRAVQPTVRLMA